MSTDTAMQPVGEDVRPRRVPKPRRSKVNVERAQVASQRLIAAVCRDLGWLWNRQEALQAQARTRTEAAAAVQPLIEVCMTCPIVNECRTWAAEDSYSGVAAGTVWHEGHESALARVSQLRQRRRSSIQLDEAS